MVADALQLGLPLGAIYSVLPLLDLTAGAEAEVRRLVNVVLIGAVGYVLARLVNLAADKVHASHLKLDFSTSVRARTLYTQVSLLRRMALVVVGFVSLAAMLLLFAPVRQLGASLLASAGVVGVIAGVAAQRSLANLVAGFQIAVTQPILLEDVVTVEGEYGQIEEITLTFVVVRLWDLRRLVLPISYFLEKPFQNWTRGSPEVVGAVFLYVDPLAPLDALEAEFERVLEAEREAEHWNGQTKKFVVFEAHERSLQLRLTMSADDPNRLWDLRAAVRRAMADFLRREHPEALPRLRAVCNTQVGALERSLWTKRRSPLRTTVRAHRRFSAVGARSACWGPPHQPWRRDFSRPARLPTTTRRHRRARRQPRPAAHRRRCRRAAPRRTSTSSVPRCSTSRRKPPCRREPTNTSTGRRGTVGRAEQNIERLRTLALVPRRLAGFAQADTASALFGRNVKAPLYVCPMGAQDIVHAGRGTRHRARGRRGGGALHAHQCFQPFVGRSQPSRPA